MPPEESTPAYSETYMSLANILDEVRRGLRELGKIEGRNDLESNNDLRHLVLDVSKKIIQSTPAHQLEREEIDDAEAKLCSILNKLSDEEVT